MFKKLKWRVITETASFLSILCLGFIFLILAANCNNADKSAKEGNKDSSSAYSSTTTPSSDAAQTTDTARVNWLDVHPGWDTVAFKSSPDNQRGIELEKKKIRAYVRGWLDEYNIDHGTHYVVAEFNFIQKSRAPLRYTVTAYLNPPARHHEGPGDVGGHLIPSEPDPPDTH